MLGSKQVIRLKLYPCENREVRRQQPRMLLQNFLAYTSKKQNYCVKTIISGNKKHKRKNSQKKTSHPVTLGNISIGLNARIIRFSRFVQVVLLCILTVFTAYIRIDSIDLLPQLQSWQKKEVSLYESCPRSFFNLCYGKYSCLLYLQMVGQ